MFERLNDVGKKKGIPVESDASSTTQLGKFLESERLKRHMSATKFAEECNVSTSTITEAINGKTINPTLLSLRKIANYTHVPLTALIMMAYPDAADEISNLSPDDLILAVRWHDLDPILKKAVISIMNSE